MRVSSSSSLTCSLKFSIRLMGPAFEHCLKEEPIHQYSAGRTLPVSGGGNNWTYVIGLSSRRPSSSIAWGTDLLIARGEREMTLKSKAHPGLWRGRGLLSCRNNQGRGDSLPASTCRTLRDCSCRSRNREPVRY